MSTIERRFTLTQTFSHISEMKISHYMFGKCENHYGIKWLVSMQRSDSHASMCLACYSERINTFAISTQFKFEITSFDGHSFHKQRNFDFKKNDTDSEFPEFIDWSLLENEYLKNDELQVKCHVTILHFIGVIKKPAMPFDKSMERFPDVILKVGGHDLYVSKLTLAVQSPYFERLFLGGLEESNKSMVELKGVDFADFLDYLQLIYTKSVVSDFNLELMLELCDKYDTPMVLEKCEDQLMNEKSELSMKDKLRLIEKFKLKKLMNFLVGKCKTSEELRDVIPDDLTMIDPKILRQVLDKISSKC